MSNNIKMSAARIAREVPAAECKIDDAMISVSSLIATLVRARRENGLSSSLGQASILRLAKAQMSLVSISNDVLRVHSDLVKINEEYAGFDLHECPESGQADSGPVEAQPVSRLVSVA